MTLRECLNTDALPPVLDMYVCEYASQPLFWNLSIFIGACLIFYIFQDKSHVRFGGPHPDPEEAAELAQYLPYRRAAPAFMRRLRPHLTSNLRKTTVVLIYLVGLILQCTETYWVFTTWWRLVWKYTAARSAMLAREHTSMLFQVVTLFPTVIWVTFGTNLTLTCLYVVGSQISSLREIITIDPASPTTISTDLPRTNASDGKLEKSRSFLEEEHEKSPETV